MPLLPPVFTSFTPQTEWSKLLARQEADLATKTRMAAFTVLEPSADLYLLLRIEKVLQSDVNTINAIYAKVRE